MLIVEAIWASDWNISLMVVIPDSPINRQIILTVMHNNFILFLNL